MTIDKNISGDALGLHLFNEALETFTICEGKIGD